MAASTTILPRIPHLVYGTAWKAENTQRLVKQAIRAGFRAIDTAAQPKHYREDLVGQGVRDAISEGIVTREELYIQTKYTPPHGQDPQRMPYNADKSITCQVGDSLTKSLKHLRHASSRPQTGSTQSYIDCLILHSPFPDIKQTKEAWRAMELHVPAFVRTLGLSNVYDPALLEELYTFASTKPSVLQKRFYRATGYDTNIRAFCAEHEITYQSFWTLTANPELLRSDLVASLAAKVGILEVAALYALVIGLGKVSVLDGTTNRQRMVEDLAGMEKALVWAEAEGEGWREAQAAFRALVGGTQVASKP